MFPPFNQELARHYTLEIISGIEAGNFILEQISQVSQERSGSGLMIGTLVCWNKIEQRRIVLHAVSGIARKLETKNKENIWISKGIVHIVVDAVVESEQINVALEKNDREIHRLTDLINSCEDKIEKSKLKNIRTKLTDESLKNVFSLYDFYRFDGKKISLNKIIEKHNGNLPPAGTGDCCAPKLLNYAFRNDLQIISMDEVFFGKDTKNKTNGESYAPCDERCGYILPSILGLEILYRDSAIVVINKQSGLLSVPGKGEEKQDCAVSRLKKLYPQCIEQPSVHRLDMETSGILVMALTKETHRNLNMQFAEGKVHKKYAALLDGIVEKASGNAVPKNGEKNGCIQLKFRLDPDNRPYQIYDEVNGKNGITLWENAGAVNYVNPDTREIKKVTKMIYTPLTGRTHQLRLVSSDVHGFGLPIIGDSLYGNKTPSQRLMLHCFEIEFYHPVSGEKLKFYCEERGF